MLRDRLLHRRWLVYLIVGWGAALAWVPRAADGAPLPPVLAPGADTDLDADRALPEAKIVRAELRTLGVSPADAEATLERLGPAERSELAARAGGLGAGGSGVEFLAFALIVGLLVILILELTGRHVISRP